jgi:hypothetical protein
LNLPAKYLCHTPQGFLARRKIEQHETDGLTSPPKEVVLLNFIAHKYPSDGFEPAKFVFNGKQANH